MSNDLFEKAKKKFNELNNTEDTTAEFDEKDIQDNKLIACLAYLSWLVLIPLFAAKESKFARYHANQGIMLAIAETIVWIIFEAFLVEIPFIGWIFSIVLWLFNLLTAVFVIVGILNALNGRAKELPIIGKFKILK